MFRLNGLIAATFTPFKGDGTINPALIPQQVDFLRREGIDGIFTCGTTGEYSSLTDAERKELVEHYAAAAAGRIPHIVHVGHNSLEAARDLARHAQANHAAAISAAPPSYFRVGSPEVMVDCCERIAEAAPQTPFYYYHIPSMSGAAISVVRFLELAEKRLPTLAGVKFTHYDLMEYQLCREAVGGRYDILFGRDEFYLASLAMGSTGAVGSTYNYIAPLFHKMREAFLRGDLESARAAQLAANKTILLLIQYGGIATGKALLRMRGLDTGPCRLPNKPLSRETEKQIYQEAVRHFPEFQLSM